MEDARLLEAQIRCTFQPKTGGVFFIAHECYCSSGEPVVIELKIVDVQRLEFWLRSFGVGIARLEADLLSP